MVQESQPTSALGGLVVAVLQKNGDSGPESAFWRQNLDLNAATGKGLAIGPLRPWKHWATDVLHALTPGENPSS